MAEEKRILVVDDHYDTLRFLRTLLEMADERFKVTGVLSGEEAGLELRRPYDLLITDIRLPGVDGVQVAQRARRLSPEMPVIVISGFPKEMLRLEESGIDVFRSFRKPLIAEEILEAVYIAILGEAPQPPEPEVSEPEPTAVVEQLIIDSAVPAEVHKRLELLRSNTGADELMLATINGDISAESGVVDMSVPAIAQTIAKNLRGSFALADQLGHPEGHQSIQYHNTARFDLYTANVGEYHFITMFFDAAKLQRGRIGTVWVFIQRAIKDLEPLLTHVKVKKEVVAAPVAPALPPTAVSLPTPTQPAEVPAVPTRAKPRRPGLGEAFSRAAAVSRTEEEQVQTPKPVTAPAFYVPPPAVDLPPLNDEEMAELATLEVGDDDSAEAFWDTAVEGLSNNQSLATGLTLEEAMRQGMLPTTVPQDSPFASLLEDHDLAPGAAIPAELLAESDGLLGLTLDLGDLEDEDDFDLSGMPGFDSPTSDDATLEALGDEATAHPHALRDEDLAKLANFEISDTAENAEVEAFWNALMTGDTAKGTRTDGLTFDEAVAQGFAIEDQVEATVHSHAPHAPQSPQKETTAPVSAALSELDSVLSMEDGDADSFWAEASAEAGDENPTAGMSLEEAIRKGLLPSTFKLNDR